MNYRELAQIIDRPYNTVRKWRGEITQISGHHFKRIKVSNGRGRKNRTTYDFDKLDVKRFMLLAHFLKEGKTKAEAIHEIFCNKEIEDLQEEREEVLDRRSLISKKKIEKLEVQVNHLQSELNTLREEKSDLTKRIEKLETRGLKNILKKK